MCSTEGGRSSRYLWRCRGCRRQYTVRIGTIFEDSRIEMRHWCYAFWAACASKKGVSALQIKRMTGLSYKSALFMMHRIRYAMIDPHDLPPKLTGTVEADETYVGGRPRYRRPENKGSKANKAPVFAVVQRGGDVRARAVADVTNKTLHAALLECVSPSARLITDEWKGYRSIGKHFGGGHEYVKHKHEEYVRGDVYTNTIEGFFSLLKRGIYGTFHAVSRKHLGMYVGEFEFRYNGRYLNDGQRVVRALRSTDGKHLTYAAHVSKP